MLEHLLPTFGVAFLALSVAMGVAWYVAGRINNWGLVDVVWGFAFAALVPFYAYGSDSPFTRKALAVVAAVLWSGRLGAHLLIRFLKLHPIEDVRYKKLREKWGRNLKWKMFLFYELQAAMLVVLSLPFGLVLSNRSARISIWEFSGFALLVVGSVAEALADHQLARFKAAPENKGRVCKIGLWRYSRHPNYFFEWINWCALFIFALGSDFGWAALYAPILMYGVLRYLTGIPLTEEMAVYSKGEAYRQYQAQTPVFFPWKPKLQ